MKVLLLLFSLIWAMPAWAAGPTLYKEFSYGQSRAEIQRLPGVYACDEVDTGALCRSQQSFASFDGWEQIFLFSNDKLVVVALAADTSESLYTNVFGVMHNNGFFTVVMQAGNKVFDFAQAIREYSVEAAAAKLTQTEAALLNDSAPLTYIMCPKEAVKAASKVGSFSLYAQKAPVSLRATEVIISSELMMVRFLAPVAALHDMKRQMDSQKERF